MGNSVSQNPSNKVGRNSGGGPVGVSRYLPSEREAARGLAPGTIEGGRRWTLRRAVVGVVALFVGAGYYAIRERTKKRLRGGQLRRLAFWR